MPTSDVTHRETVGLLAHSPRAAMLAGRRGERREEVKRRLVVERLAK